MENRIFLAENLFLLSAGKVVLLRKFFNRMNMTLKRIKWKVWLMMFIGCAVCGTSCQNGQKEETKQQGYTLATVRAGQNKEIVTSYSASIEGRQDIDIFPQVSGYIVKLNVSEGDAVKKGQVLFVID